MSKNVSKISKIKSFLGKRTDLGGRIDKMPRYVVIPTAVGAALIPAGIISTLSGSPAGIYTEAPIFGALSIAAASKLASIIHTDKKKLRKVI